MAIASTTTRRVQGRRREYFNIVRPLRLLDLTAIEHAHDIGSIFDPTFRTRLERIAFLRTLGGRMARPVVPDEEATEYLPTQAVADFLATTNEPRLDGIVFSFHAGRTRRERRPLPPCRMRST